jgi:hypothetical protein
MSRHIPRHARWDRRGPNEYRAGGSAVRYERGAWWAVISYKQLPEETTPGPAPGWEERCQRLGPFKRPRNAMIAAEDHVSLLRRRHGARVAIEGLFGIE